MKTGPDEGNSGAILRWGKCLDNGIWIRGWRFKKLWTQWKFRQGYISLGIIVLHYGN